MAHSSGPYSAGDRHAQHLPSPDHPVIQAVNCLRIVVFGNRQMQRIPGPQARFISLEISFAEFDVLDGWREECERLRYCGFEAAVEICCSGRIYELHAHVARDQRRKLSPRPMAGG